jgi:hypothetical protein
MHLPPPLGAAPTTELQIQEKNETNVFPEIHDLNK